jgi:hypothetical protein
MPSGKAKRIVPDYFEMLSEFIETVNNYQVLPATPDV